MGHVKAHPKALSRQRSIMVKVLWIAPPEGAIQ